MIVDAQRLLDLLVETNRVDFAGFQPFTCSGQRVGWLRAEMRDLLAGFPDVFVVLDGEVRVNDDLVSPEKRTRAIGDAVQSLLGQDGFGRWNDEFVAVPGPAGEPLYDHPRCAVPRFGIRTFGAHVNGYVVVDGETHLWIAERGHNGDGFDGQLDTLAGGLVPAGADPFTVARDEAEEEAGIGADLLPAITAVGSVKGTREFSFGMSPYGVYCFDLMVPPDYPLSPEDNEVAGFELMSAEDLVTAIEDRRFKFNAVPVVIDWLLRHGRVAPQDPRYIGLGAALHSWDPD